MRLLLVDDELPTREYLVALADWAKLGYEFLEAENGRVAIDLMGQTQIDLLLLDITMPVMNGLEVLEWIKRNEYDCVVTLLTCHDEFEYAKKAIQYGCFDHVLKSSITAESILALVDRMRAAASDEQRIRQYYSRLEAEAQHKRHLETQRVLDYWLRDGEVPFDGIAAYLEQRLGLSDDKNRYAALSIHIRHYPEVVRRYTDNNVVRFSTVLDGVLHELLEGKNHFYSQPSDGLYFVLLWFDRHTPMQELLSHLKELTQRIWSSFRNILVIDLAVIYSLPFKSVADGRLFYLQTCSLLALQFFKCLEGVACIEDYVLDADACTSYLEQFEHRFSAELATRSAVQAELCFDQFVSQVSEDRLCPPEDAFLQCCERCLLKFLSDCTEERTVYTPLSPAADVDVLKARLMEYILPHCISENNQDKTSIIKRTLLLIQQHYAEDISLEWLASRLFVSSSYLSRLFSEEMGQPLTTYLSSYRIERAKRLVRTSNLKLYEIAERVGFSSPIVFSTIFKRVTGETPSTYKNKN